MVDAVGGQGAKRQRTGDVTSQLISALKQQTARHAAPVSAPANDDLAARLRAALGGMNAAEVCQSGVGQQLFDTVQRQLGPTSAPMAAPAAAPFALMDYPSRPMPSVPVSVPPLHYGTVAPPKRELREEDEDSDEGVPHRLPPGFGAIPEDIVEERARLREEQRMLQIKATQPCRFGRRCKRRDCPNMHRDGREIDEQLNPCAFGRKCKRKGCFYDHPEGRIIDEDPTSGMCKYGARCSRPDCLYDHPPDRAVLVGAEARICFFCHDPGHVATECPLNPDSMRFAMGAIAGPPPPRALMNG